MKEKTNQSSIVVSPVILLTMLVSIGFAQPTTRQAATPPDQCAAATKVLWLQTQFRGTDTSSVISVKAPRGCAWTVQSQAPWIKFHRTEFRGYAVFSFKLEPNAQASRSAAIVLAGQTFTISQTRADASSIVALTTTANTPVKPAAGGGVQPTYGANNGYYGSPTGGTGAPAAGIQLSSYGSAPGMGTPALPAVVVPPVGAGAPLAHWTNADDTGAVVALATAKGQLYQLRKNGAVLHYTKEEKWEVIDNDPNTRTLVSWQNRLYQWCLNDGVLVWNENARRWDVVDDKAMALAVTDNNLYTLRATGLWQWTGYYWLPVKTTYYTQAIVATTERLYQLCPGQGIWEFDETKRVNRQIDARLEIKSLTVSGNELYRTLLDGTNALYAGHDWLPVLGKIPAKMLVTTGKAIFYLDENGLVWRTNIG
jgi:hypothetical protein